MARFPSIVVLSALLTAAVPAQVWYGTPTVNTVTANYTPAAYGNSNFGGSIDARSTKTTTALGGVVVGKATAGLYATVRIFNSSREAAAIDCVAEGGNGAIFPWGSTYMASTYVINPNSTRVNVRLAGRTLWTESYSGTNFTRQWARTWPSQDIGTFSGSFHVIGIPITVRASASAGGNLNFNAAFNSLAHTGSLGGSANTFASGSLSCSAGWSWANVGVTSAINLAGAHLAASVAATTTSFHGHLDASIDPINVNVNLTGHLWPNINGSLNLINYSTPQRTYSISF